MDNYTALKYRKSVSNLMNIISFSIALFSCTQSFAAKSMSMSSPMPLGKSTEVSSPVNILDTLVDEAKKQIDQVAVILASLSSMVNDNQIPVQQKKETLRAIKGLVSLVHSIQQEKFVNIDLATTLFLLRFNSALMDHIAKAIASDLNNIPPFNPAEIATKTFGKKVNVHEVEQHVLANKKKLTALIKKADHAGLRWYNLAYRQVDKYIISPSVKYSIPQRTLIAAAGIFTVLTTWWYLNEETFEKQFPTLHNKFYGPHPKTNKYDGSCENEKDLKAFGTLESFANKLVHNHLPIFGAIGGFFLWGAMSKDKDGTERGSFWGLKQEWQRFYKKLTKKVRALHHWLLGGSHLKEANKINNFVDKVTFDDLVGLDQVKNEFKLLVSYLQNPEPFDRLGLTPPKGILLDGPTRTGKSYSVKALYNEIQSTFGTDKKHMFKFIPLDAPTINKEGIGYLLGLIRKHAPCVVFIDEIDLLDLQRKGKNETLSEFLTLMSGYLDNQDSKHQVIIIAATNRPENLDVALRQPGRFGKELHFEYPSYANRLTYIERKLNKLSLDISNFDTERMARETEGQSYEALNTLINNAVLKARINGQMVTQAHIDATFDEELLHEIKEVNKEVPQKEREILGAHFAGHALAANMLNSNLQLTKVTIRDVMITPKEEAMGLHLYNADAPTEQEKKSEDKRLAHGAVFTHKQGDSIGITTREEKRKLCMFHLAGIVAEEILLGSCGFSCHAHDMKYALDIAQSIAFEGLNEKTIKTLPKSMQEERYKGAFTIINECKEEIRKALMAQKDVLTKIYEGLVAQDSLSAQEVKDIINPPTPTVEESPEEETPSQTPDTTAAAEENNQDDSTTLQTEAAPVEHQTTEHVAQAPEASNPQPLVNSNTEMPTQTTPVSKENEFVINQPFAPELSIVN